MNRRGSIHGRVQDSFQLHRFADRLARALRRRGSEVAARAHMQRLLPVIDEAWKGGGSPRSNRLYRVHHTPGWFGALLVGVSAAKMLALALEVPLVCGHHVEATFMLAGLAAGSRYFSVRRVVVSGGHLSVQLQDAFGFFNCRRHADDAAGEAFDKVASILGLGFLADTAVEKEGVGATPRRTSSALVLKRSTAGFQLQRSQDGGSLCCSRQDKSLRLPP